MRCATRSRRPVRYENQLPDAANKPASANWKPLVLDFIAGEFLKFFRFICKGGLAIATPD